MRAMQWDPNAVTYTDREGTEKKLHRKGTAQGLPPTRPFEDVDLDDPTGERGPGWLGSPENGEPDTPELADRQAVTYEVVAIAVKEVWRTQVSQIPEADRDSLTLGDLYLQVIKRLYGPYSDGMHGETVVPVWDNWQPGSAPWLLWLLTHATHSAQSVLRDYRPISRYQTDMVKRLTTAENALWQTLNRAPTSKEVARELGTKVSTIETWKMWRRAASGRADIDTLSEADFGINRSPEDQLVNDEVFRIALEALKTLKPRDQDFIRKFILSPGPDGEPWKPGEAAADAGMDRSAFTKKRKLLQQRWQQAIAEQGYLLGPEDDPNQN